MSSLALSLRIMSSTSNSYSTSYPHPLPLSSRTFDPNQVTCHDKSCLAIRGFHFPICFEFASRIPKSVTAGCHGCRNVQKMRIRINAVDDGTSGSGSREVTSTKFTVEQGKRILALQKDLLEQGSHEQLINKHSRNCFMGKGGEPLMVRKTIAGTSIANSQTQNSDLPRILPGNRKKPFVVPPRRVPKKGFKKPFLEDPYSPPGNGLLVPELIPVAYAVFEARNALLQSVATLMDVVPVKACRFCEHSHVGPVGHDIATCNGQGSHLRDGRHAWTTGHVYDVISNLDAFHSYDRSNIIRDKYRHVNRRLPAVVELCIQAGVDLPEYPVVRRTEPVRFTGRRRINIGDIYSELPEESELLQDEVYYANASVKAGSLYSNPSMGERSSSGLKLHNNGWKIDLDQEFEELLKHAERDRTVQGFADAKEIAEMSLRLWEVMRTGAQRLMSKYTVRACGYCPEVHIGPRGHLVKLCGAFKHQWRQGKHGWQVAGLDDLIPPKYVWHVPDLKKPLLSNELKRFYGQAPAIVELCVQAGAEIPEKYRPMMRLDVVEPSSYESGNAV